MIAPFSEFAPRVRAEIMVCLCRHGVPLPATIDATPCGAPVLIDRSGVSMRAPLEALHAVHSRIPPEIFQAPPRQSPRLALAAA